MRDLPVQSPAELQERLGYTFRDVALLDLALTHSSYLQDHPDTPDSNQRLEFLGDAVIQLVLTEELFSLYPEDREGSLSKRRATLSKGLYLSQLARQIGLDASLRLSQSEEQTGGRSRTAALEDAFEALVGAVYLDSDLSTTRRVVLALYGSLPERLDQVQAAENPKGQLQELVQPLHGNHAIRYEVAATLGHDHARQYEVHVFFKDERVGVGRGSSKKSAEELAAREALSKLKADITT